MNKNLYAISLTGLTAIACVTTSGNTSNSEIEIKVQRPVIITDSLTGRALELSAEQTEAKYTNTNCSEQVNVYKADGSLAPSNQPSDTTDYVAKVKRCDTDSDGNPDFTTVEREGFIIEARSRLLGDTGKKTSSFLILKYKEDGNRASYAEDPSIKDCSTLSPLWR